MARRSRDMAVDEAEVQAQDETAPQDPTERVSIMFGLPWEMKELLKKRADEQETNDGETGVPLAEYIRDLLADAIGYTIPERTTKRTKRYASEEEKKAAQKARAKDRRNTIKQLLKLYQSDPSLAAKLATMQAEAGNGGSDGEDEEDDGEE